MKINKIFVEVISINQSEIFSVFNVREITVEKECLYPLAKGWERWWWLDTDRQGVPDDCGCNRKRATASGCQTILTEQAEQLECRWWWKTATTDDLAGLIPQRADSSIPASWNAAHDMPLAQVWNSLVPGDVASVISRGQRSYCDCNDEVKTPTKLQC